MSVTLPELGENSVDLHCLGDLNVVLHVARLREMAIPSMNLALPAEKTAATDQQQGQWAVRTVSGLVRQWVQKSQVSRQESHEKRENKNGIPWAY